MGLPQEAGYKAYTNYVKEIKASESRLYTSPLALLQAALSG